MEFAGLSEAEATGWKQGLYRDVKRTFRAPVVNAIVRVPTAAEPRLTRYAWGQVKPVFQTRAFAEYATRYRDALLSPVEDAFDLPTYTPGDLGVAPGEFRELQGQTATFDAVYPCLAALIALWDRGFHGDSIGAEPARGVAATEPFSGGERETRPLAPTLLDPDGLPEKLEDTAAAIRAHHGFEDGLATVHRCHAQWPSFLEAAWAQLEPVLASEAYRRGVERASDLVAEFVDAVPYRPRLGPADLAAVGADDGQIERLQEIVRAFSHGPPLTVVRTIPLYALLAGVEERSPL